MIIRKNVLLASYATVSPFAGKKSSVIEAAKYVKIDVADGRISLSATNTEKWIEMVSDCVVGDSGKASFLAPKQFFDILKLCTSDDVEVVFNKDNSRLNIVDGVSSYTVAVKEVDEYPHCQDVSYGDAIIVDADELSRAIKVASVARSSMTSRPILSGVNIQSSGDGVIVVQAIDGFVLSRYDIQTDVSNDFSVTIISPEALATIVSGDVEMHISDRFVSVKSDKITVVVSTIYGNFPDMSSFKRSGYKYKFTVRLSDISRAINIADMTGSEVPIAKFKGEGEVLHVVGRGDIGETDTVIKCTGNVDGVEFALNTSYLRRLLSTPTSHEVAFFVDDEKSPIKIIDGKNNFKIIMPMHLER